MIKIYNTQGIPSYALNKPDNFYITSKMGAIKTLSFDINPKDDLYKYIAEEIKVEYNDLVYNVKKINERKTASSIECELDLDDFKLDIYEIYEKVEMSLTNILSNILVGTGWTVIDDEVITHKHTIRLENVNKYDIIMECVKQYDCYFKFDNKNKIIKVIDYISIQSKGVYLTDQLNLTSIDFKGDSSDFCTRLIARGKKNEDTGEYLTFADINGGKDYVDNFDYSNKIITKIWIDERYTDKQELKDNAIEQLKILAYPKRSYSCNVLDLAKVNPEYSILSFDLYDIVTLIDNNRKTIINHRIVEYKEYPDNPNNNVVTLSTITQQIKSTIEKVDNIINNASDIKVNGVMLNQIKRDNDSNTASIKNMYTKGQTDTIVQSAIQQSSDEITLYVDEQSKLKSTTYSLPPDTYLLNDTFCPDKDYVTPTITFEKGVNYLAINSNDVSTQKLLMFSDGKLLKFSDEKYLVFPDVISDNWDKKDNYQTDKDVSASLKITSDSIIQACQNGALSTSTKFSANNGLEIFNGDLTVYDKTEDDNTKEKVFFVDSITGDILFTGILTNSQRYMKTKIGQFVMGDTYFPYQARGIGLYNNSNTLVGAITISDNIRSLNESIGEVFDNTGVNIQSLTQSASLSAKTGDFSINPSGISASYGAVNIFSYYNNVVNTDVGTWNFNNLYTNGVKVTSDRQLKKDIKQNTSYALDKLKGVNFYAYTLNKPIKDKDGNIIDYDNSYSTKIGLMYDECPDDIATIDVNGEKHIDLYASISLAIKSIQELNKKVDRQALKISTLENENAELKKQLTREKIERQIVTNNIKKGLINNG